MEINTDESQGKEGLKNLLEIFKKRQYQEKQKKIIREIFKKNDK